MIYLQPWMFHQGCHSAYKSANTRLRLSNFLFLLDFDQFDPNKLYTHCDSGYQSNTSIKYLLEVWHKMKHQHYVFCLALFSVWYFSVLNKAKNIQALWGLCEPHGTTSANMLIVSRYDVTQVHHFSVLAG